MKDGIQRNYHLTALLVLFVSSWSLSFVEDAPAEIRWKPVKLESRGGRVDWYKGVKHNLIAYDAITDMVSGNTDLFVIQPDGSGKKCLTRNTEVPKGFIGQPAWHPDGEHIVFQAENSNSGHRLLNHMAWGFNNDLWLIKRNGTGAQRIWFSPLNHAALHPHFNRDGSRIVFARRSQSGKPKYWIKKRNLGGCDDNHWDGWSIHVADFDSSRSGKNMLSNHRILQPNKNGFYETHGFTDDGRIVYSFTSKGKPYVDDIYICDSDGNNVKKLIHSPHTWDEHGSFSPSGQAFAFISSRGDKTWRAPGSRALTLRTELYLKRDDSVIQLTNFNSKKDVIRYVVSDFDWNKTGDRIVFQVVPFTGIRSASPQLWILVFTNAQ